MINISKLIKKEKAFTIIESLVAISLFSLFIIIFGASSFIITTSQHLKYKNLAYYLAQEEIETLRQTEFSDLTDRANEPFMNVIYNKGTWQVSAMGSSPSLPNSYELGSLDGNPSGVTGLATIPGFEYDDFTLETNINVKSDSPAGWESGFYARYHDTNNFYSIYFDSSNLYITKNVGGSSTTLDSKVKAFLTDTWYKIKLVATGSSFDVYVNDILELSTTDPTNSFSQGWLALYSENSAHAYYDEVDITTGSTQTWDFDSDSVGEVPDSWTRFGINDLQGGTTKLTIEDSEPGSSDIKLVTSRVEWTERNQTKSVELITQISFK